MFRRKLKISLLNNKWETLIPVFKVDVIPKIGEYMWWTEQDTYYKVINVVHNINDGKVGIFVILEEILNDDENKLKNT